MKGGEEILIKTEKSFTLTVQEKWVYLYQEMTYKVSRWQARLYGMGNQHGARCTKRLEILFGQINREVVSDYVYSGSEIPFSDEHGIGGGHSGYRTY